MGEEELQSFGVGVVKPRSYAKYETKRIYIGKDRHGLNHNYEIIKEKGVLYLVANYDPNIRISLIKALTIAEEKSTKQK